MGLGALLWVTAAAPAAEPETRLALVIGIGNYVHAPELVTPVRDAEAIADQLRALDFDVDLQLNLGGREVADALRAFGIRASTADVAVIYYAGHGVQVDGTNYLVPADAELERVRDLLYEAVPLPLFLGELAGAKKLGVMILDACRNNPFVERLVQSMGAARTAQIGPGLTRVDDTPSDTLVAMSTRANAVAEDGTDDHSPYAEALIEELKAPGLELGLFFRRVRDRVLSATQGRQEPFTFGSLGAAPFYFNPRPPNRAPVLAATTPLEVLDDAGPTPLAIPAPSDPDGDAMVVQIMQLPRGGNVLVSGRPVLIGEYLTPEQLRSAAFAPDGSLRGEAGLFQFLVDDRQGGQTNGAVAVVVKASNRPPELAPLQSARAVVNRLTLAPPRDPDGDPLTIRVRRVPDHGKVRLGNQTLAPGDRLEPGQLGRLTYDAEDAPVGSSQELSLTVDDGRGGEAETVVTIAVAGDGAAAPAPPAAPLAAGPSPATQATEAAPAGQLPAGVTLEPLPGSFAAATDANLRAGPSNAAARVGRVAAGTPLAVLGRVAGSRWVYVDSPEGEPAFIFGDLLAKREEPTPPAATIAAAEPPAMAAPTALREPKAVLVRESDGVLDCPDCPVLVRINPGAFTMGSQDGDPSRRPARKVVIEKPFAIGKYEVTVAEWRVCVKAGACAETRMNQPTDGMPVFNVHWQDAQAYVAWLSRETGKAYHLPSEAQWEYAARAGTTSAYWWGDRLERGRVICRSCDTSGFDRLRPPVVDSQPANPFGLVGMSGGVAEWLVDCWFKDYAGAPTDGSARDAPACTKRVLRGGSWRDEPADLEVSSRNFYDVDVRYLANGFRVARELE